MLNTIGRLGVIRSMTTGAWAEQGDEARRLLRLGMLQGIASLALLVVQPFAFFYLIASSWARDRLLSCWFGLGAVPILLALSSASMSLRARLQDRTTRQTFCAMVAGFGAVVAIVGLLFTTVFGLGLVVLSGVHWGCVDCR